MVIGGWCGVGWPAQPGKRAWVFRGCSSRSGPNPQYQWPTCLVVRGLAGGMEGTGPTVVRGSGLALAGVWLFESSIDCQLRFCTQE